MNLCDQYKLKEMGKVKKEHRKKVQNRNLKLKQNEVRFNRLLKSIYEQQLEKLKNGETTQQKPEELDGE